MMIDDEMLLEELEENGAILFENPSYDSALVGITHTGRAVYNYRQMINCLVEEGMTRDLAEEFINYNTIRAIPYMGEKAPVVVYFK